ncbi:Dabb family protein [Sphingopyxis sp.]|jgi:hypothetical protein|uniref:Dabb family protein n=1 Tax=Sphingopyxis sp. TaxID=1908224 RepID=UPI002DE229B8|nr:Dabb family protein [Sphingopyxis sp.]
MLIHMFAFRWAPQATAEDRDRAIAEIRRFEGEIPGLIEVQVGENLAKRTGGYETGGFMRFSDASALEAYGGHPLHVALLAWLIPLVDPVEVDIETV